MKKQDDNKDILKVTPLGKKNNPDLVFDIIYGFVKGWNIWRTIVFWGEMVCFTSTFIYCLI